MKKIIKKAKKCTKFLKIMEQTNCTIKNYKKLSQCSQKKNKSFCGTSDDKRSRHEGLK